MSTVEKLQQRNESQCELCSSTTELKAYPIPDSPKDINEVDKSILLCNTCLDFISNPENADNNHWRCLNDSMWTPEPAVQVMSWRILNSIKAEGWPEGLLDMLYLEDDVKAWAKAGSSNVLNSDEDEQTIDSNGATLNAGDTVTLIKDLVVKGANFTAKRGTVVKNISLTPNSKHIEGRVNGTRIVLISAFLKKANT